VRERRVSTDHHTVSRRVRGLAVYDRHAESAPTGRVVLVHGAMDRGASFVKVSRRLPDVEVVRYDRRGYGRSADLGPGALAEHVADLLAVIDERPATVVGHSYGGVIAVLAARARPDLVPAVGAFEPPMPWTPWWPGHSAGGSAVLVAGEGGPGAAAEAFLRRMIGDERWDKLPPSTKADRRAEGSALLAELTEMRAVDALFDPADLTGPVVAGRGSAGAAHHRRAAEHLAVEAPDGELVVIDGAGHAAHSTHPAAFAGLVRRVLVRAADVGLVERDPAVGR
jgi:pimeloyl-ACP methyl ester carboxylesterase